MHFQFSSLISRCLVVTICLLLTSPLLATPVQLKTTAGLTANADYLEADKDAPVVLILHGFLQTGHFFTVNRLANSLLESGYNILLPTLSLGLDNRKQSLACEAIHTHSLHSEVAELKQWLDWLKQITHRPIHLIGHSAASTVLLQYLLRHGDDDIDKVILISLSYYGAGPGSYETEAYAEKAQAQLQKNNNTIDQYALNYCKNYPTYASHFMSYYQWDKTKTSRAVGQYKDRISILIGSNDKRIQTNWAKHLSDTHNNVIFIKGANHFFDHAHEFDLSDNVENILAGH